MDSAKELRELLQQNLPALEAFVRLQVGGLLSAKESCSDLVQSVCKEVLQDAGEFDYRGDDAFKKWLFVHARHKIVDRARHYARARRDAGREAHDSAVSNDEAAGILDCYGTFCTPSRDVIAREEIARIEAAFQALDDPYRELIGLCRLGGLTYAEAGAATGRTEGQVRGLVTRGLAKLARALTA